MTIHLSDNPSAFGYFVLAIAVIMAVGIYFSYRKTGFIKWKYIVAVIVMLGVGVTWLLEN